MISVEALLRSKTGARTVKQIDELLEAIENDASDRETSFHAVKILRATIKDSVLEHFLDSQGLALILRWLQNWGGVDIAALPFDGSDADKVIETLKLLRQLPVTKDQLLSNADLCRYLKRISKSSANFEAAALAKEVVDLWRREVITGGEELLFCREEIPRKTDDEVVKHCKLKTAESGKKVEAAKRGGSSSRMPDRSNHPFRSSPTRPSDCTESQDKVKTSKSIVDCSEFAAAISASEGGVRQRVHVHREKKRRHEKSTHSVKPKKINIKFSVPSDESSAPSSKAGLTQTVLTVSATSGVTKINVSQDLDSSSANPSADDVPSTAVQRDRINKGDALEKQSVPDAVVKKRVHWNSELDQVHYFVPLPPENEEEVHKPWKHKTKATWGEFWRRPEKLEDNCFPMPFIQPGSQSVEKTLRESDRCLWSSSPSFMSRFDSVLDATIEASDAFCPMNETKEIPLEPQDFLDYNEGPPKTQPPLTDSCPFSDPSQYNLFPSPPYSL